MRRDRLTSGSLQWSECILHDIEKSYMNINGICVIHASKSIFNQTPLNNRLNITTYASTTCHAGYREVCKHAQLMSQNSTIVHDSISKCTTLVYKITKIVSNYHLHIKYDKKIMNFILLKIRKIHDIFLNKGGGPLN